MPIQAVQVQATSWTPTTLLSLFILDGTSIGLSEIFYFHDGTNSSFQPVVFNGQTYLPFPIQVKGFGMDGRGTPNRPTITAANINGFVSNLLLQNQSLVGAKFIRQRVFARFLDNANWASGNPYGQPDPTAAYPQEIWFVNRKITENQQTVEWELGSLFELDGIKLPGRVILSNICSFKYRQVGTCNYTGVPVADSNNKTFMAGYGLTLNPRGVYDPTATYNAGDYVMITSSLTQYVGLLIYYVCTGTGVTGPTNAPLSNPSVWVQDACPKSIAGCSLRFPAPLSLRIGAYPGTSQAPFIVSK